MNRREKELQKIREQKLVTNTSRIYISAVTEILFEAGLKKEDIQYLLSELTEKVENLNRGYIDIDTYLLSVEEKTGIKLD